MKSPKLCRGCHEREKDKGSPSYCAECRWRKMPISQRRDVVAYRLSLIPSRCATGSDRALGTAEPSAPRGATATADQRADQSA